MMKSFWARPVLIALGIAAATGCATTPQYGIRPTPTPVETSEAHQIEMEISRVQAAEFEKQGTYPLRTGESVQGFDVVSIALRLAKVTERPYLPYQVILYDDKDPNAAALADGRIYVSTGMLEYLKGRGSNPNELAFILGHELGHTVAQHVVQRYETLAQQQMLINALSAGAAAVTKDGSGGAQRTVVTIASVLQQVSLSGHSQQQELEADQLGVRYVMRAGFDPLAALSLFEDFKRFDSPSGLLRTHPYSDLRREYVERYLIDIGVLSPPAAPQEQPSAQNNPAPPRFQQAPLLVTPGVPMIIPAAPANPRTARLKDLRDAQKLYPRDSISWKNLQQQIEELEKGR